MLDQGSTIDNYTSSCNDSFGAWSFTHFADGDVIEDVLGKLLEKTTVDESTYTGISLTMQLAIRVLQKVDPFAQNQRAALSMRKNILAQFSETQKLRTTLIKPKKL